MNKNQKSVMFLGFIFIMVIGMLFIYSNFQNDKTVQAQNQQVLTPDQMANGLKSFMGTMTSTIKSPPPLP